MFLYFMHGSPEMIERGSLASPLVTDRLPSVQSHLYSHTIWMMMMMMKDLNILNSEPECAFGTETERPGEQAAF